MDPLAGNPHSPSDNMTRSQILRLTFSLAMLPVGAVFVLLSTDSKAGHLVESLGLALMVAGVLEAFRQVAILKLETEEVGSTVAREVTQQVCAALPQAAAIRPLAPVRRGYDGYYDWVASNRRQDIFMAGRSVLHRVDRDLRDRNIGSAEEILYRKLCEQSQIRILLLDPRSEIIDRLAREEGQTVNQMLADIATSLGICRRLSKLIDDKPPPRLAALDIRVYDEIPYFAFHRVDNHVVIGFYFRTTLGSSSSAFGVEDPATQTMFGEHFASIYSQAQQNTVLQISDKRPGGQLNEVLMAALAQRLTISLDHASVEQLLSTRLPRG